MSSSTLTPDHPQSNRSSVSYSDLYEDAMDSADSTTPTDATKKRTRLPSKPSTRNSRRRILAAAKAVEKAAEQEREKEQEAERRRESQKVALEFIEKVLRALFGSEKYTIHEVDSKSPECLAFDAAIVQMEAERSEPLNADDPAFQSLGTKWFTEPGIHIVFDSQIDEIVFACHIEPYDAMAASRRKEVQECLQVIMDYTTCTADVKINAARNKSHGVESHDPVTPRVRHGKMFAAGWHASMEAGKTLVAYAPLRKESAVDTYKRCYSKFPKVAHLYRDGLMSLYPAGGNVIDTYSASNDAPSFASTVLDGDSVERPFANSLTITRDNFSNYLHVDRDEIEVAFGLWWVGKLITNGSGTEYCLDPKYDHDKVKGGAFVVSTYGIGVDFQKTSGLVQLYWRGKFDRHSTMYSTGPPDATRFGTSVQLTGKGMAAVRRFWQVRGGSTMAAVTPLDRVHNAEDKLRGNRGKK